MHSHLISHANALAFITAGNATFTFKSLKTGNRFTYKVMAPHDQSKENANLFFVKVLTGSNNETDYCYIGYVRICNNGWQFFYGNKSRIGKDAPSVISFMFVFERLNLNLTISNLEIWHEGKCCRCGRTLTDPDSIARGIGPECAGIKEAKKQLSIQY